MSKIKKDMIAMCGMNCAPCIRHQSSSKNDPNKPACLGCRRQNKSCAFIKKKCKNIKKINNGELNFCYECQSFPCAALTKLDDTYIERYDFSMIANNKDIKKNGLDKFINKQEKKYSCAKCGQLICIHNHKCLHCFK